MQRRQVRPEPCSEGREPEGRAEAAAEENAGRFVCSLTFVLLCITVMPLYIARTTAKTQLRMHACFNSLHFVFTHPPLLVMLCYNMLIASFILLSLLVYPLLLYTSYLWELGEGQGSSKASACFC